MLLQTDPAKKGMSLADEHIGARTNGLSTFLKRVTEMSLGLPWGRGDGGVTTGCSFQLWVIKHCIISSPDRLGLY